MDFLLDVNVSSTYLCQNLGLWAVLRAFHSKYSIYKLATIGLSGEHIATPLTCSQNWPWKEKCMFMRENSNSRLMSSTGSTVLYLRVGSFSNRFLMTLRPGYTGTEVNRAVTS